MMKTLYRQPHRRKRNIGKVLVLLVVLLLAWTFSYFIKDRLYQIGGEIWSARDSMVALAEDSFNAVTLSKEDLLAENKELKRENRLLAQEVGLLRREIEVGGLAKEISVGAEARVILKPPFTAYDILILEKPAEVSVEKGDYIVSGAGFYLGKIEEVFTSTLRARLASSSGVKTIFRASDGVDLEIRGQGGGSFYMRVQKDIKILPGETLLEVNTNLPAVNVKNVVERTQDPFKEIYLSVPENIFSLDSVLILSND